MRRPVSIEPGHVAAEYWNDGGRSIDVIETETSVWTGLYDDKGNRIYSQSFVGPIGFGRSE